MSYSIIAGQKTLGDILNYCQKGDLESLQLIQANLDIWDDMALCIIQAASNGNLHIIKWLVEKYPNNNWRDYSSKIMSVCININVINWLIINIPLPDYNPEVPKDTILIEHKQPNIPEPTNDNQYRLSFCEACKNNDIYALTHLIQEYPQYHISVDKLFIRYFLPNDTCLSYLLVKYDKLKEINYQKAMDLIIPAYTYQDILWFSDNLDTKIYSPSKKIIENLLSNNEHLKLSWIADNAQFGDQFLEHVKLYKFRFNIDTLKFILPYLNKHYYPTILANFQRDQMHLAYPLLPQPVNHELAINVCKADNVDLLTEILQLIPADQVLFNKAYSYGNRDAVILLNRIGDYQPSIVGLNNPEKIQLIKRVLQDPIGNWNPEPYYDSSVSNNDLIDCVRLLVPGLLPSIVHHENHKYFQFLLDYAIIGRSKTLGNILNMVPNYTPSPAVRRSIIFSHITYYKFIIERLNIEIPVKELCQLCKDDTIILWELERHHGNLFYYPNFYYKAYKSNKIWERNFIQIMLEEYCYNHAIFFYQGYHISTEYYPEYKIGKHVAKVKIYEMYYIYFINNLVLDTDFCLFLENKYKSNGRVKAACQ
jgi:hypothetical protein